MATRRTPSQRTHDVALRAPVRPTKTARAANAAAALSVLEQFRVIFRSTKKHFQWVETATGVSGAQLWVLAELQRTPGIRVTELARALAVHQSTVSNLLERLEERGLVQRVRSAKDARNVLLSLTAAGNAVIARAPMPLEGVLPNALRSLPAAELAQLKVLLESLARHMKVRDRAGKRIFLGDM